VPASCSIIPCDGHARNDIQKMKKEKDMPTNVNIGSVFFELDPSPPIIFPSGANQKTVKLLAKSPSDEANFDFEWTVDGKADNITNADKKIATWEATFGTFDVKLTVYPKDQEQPSASFEMEVEVAEEIPNVQVNIQPSVMKVGESTRLMVTNPSDLTGRKLFWSVTPTAGSFRNPTTDSIEWDSGDAFPGSYSFEVTVRRSGVDVNSANPEIGFGDVNLNLQPRVLSKDDIVSVTLRRTATAPTDDLPLWVVIKKSTDALSFEKYNRFMDIVLCGKSPLEGENSRLDKGQETFDKLKGKRFLPYNDVEAYRLLKVATESFVMVNCGVDLHNFAFDGLDVTEVINRVGINLDIPQLRDFWLRYLDDVNGEQDATLPYLALIREKLKDAPIMHGFLSAPSDKGRQRDCFGIIREKLTNPCLLELIWSYWHEEGMLVQTMNAVAMRFQNIRASTNGRDPLANLEIDPLRPLNNLLWGGIQDEQHCLSVTRRAYEYDHHYGMSLYGKALSNFRPADSRSKFLEAFHNLLNLANMFFKEDDDTTMLADAFAVLNALKDVHLVLSEGAHNQFGDLPSTARIEMLMQQWLLARPEFREFLPTRIMVAYPEPWMDRVDAMKKLQGWTDTSILHFRNLAIFGEQIILSIRYGSWSEVNNPAQAANWSRFWRAEIQGYIHAYRAATAVDLTMDAHDVREATQRYLPPSVHLRNRLSRQMQKV
jgi:hypothetical protein